MRLKCFPRAILFLCSEAKHGRAVVLSGMVRGEIWLQNLTLRVKISLFAKFKVSLSTTFFKKNLYHVKR